VLGAEEQELDDIGPYVSTFGAEERRDLMLSLDPLQRVLKRRAARTGC
jgi:hypothetical protein